MLIHKLNKFLLLLAVIINSISCTDLVREKKLDKGNLFNYKKSGFSFLKNSIYTIDLPCYNVYTSFLNSNYLFIHDSSIYELTLDKNCDYSNKEKYISFNAFNNNLSKLDICDIKCFQVFSLKMAIGDTIKAGDYDFTILKGKFFDNKLNENVYYFESLRFGNDYKTSYFFSLKKGFIGIFANKWENNILLIAKPNGNIFNNYFQINSIHIKNDSTIIKNNIGFQNCLDTIFPTIDLNKVCVFEKEK